MHRTRTDSQQSATAISQLKLFWTVPPMRIWFRASAKEQGKRRGISQPLPSVSHPLPPFSIKDRERRAPENAPGSTLDGIYIRSRSTDDTSGRRYVLLEHTTRNVRNCGHISFGMWFRVGPILPEFLNRFLAAAHQWESPWSPREKPLPCRSDVSSLD